MQIKKAALEDLDDIYSISFESFKEEYKKEDLLYELAQNPVSNIIVIYKDSGEIVGFLDYWITFDSATIFNIAIKKSYRNQGLASQLINYSLKDLKEKGVEFYTLEVRASNLAAINLYKKAGFELITTKKKYYDNGEDALYMVKGVNL